MLVAFLVFASLLVLLLLLLLWRLWPSTRVATSVPGASPIHENLGNLPSIRDAGSVPQFLRTLHDEFGPIASFWLGEYLVVSLGSLSLIKQSERGQTIRAPYSSSIPVLAELLVNDKNCEEPVVERFSPLVASFKPFLLPWSSAKHASPIINMVKELCCTWNKLSPEDHLPVKEYMTALAVKIVTTLQLEDSDHFSTNKNIGELLSAFSALTHKLDEAVVPDLTSSSSSRSEKLNSKLEVFFGIVKKGVADKSRENVESIAALIFGEITVIANLLTWTVYYLGKMEQTKTRVIDNNMRCFLTKVVKEVTRVTAFVPFTSRINQDEKTLLGHLIEPGTLLLHSLSSVAWNRELFPQPENFEPDRFNPDIPSVNILDHVNPGCDSANSFSYQTVVLVADQILSRFRIHLAEEFESPGIKYGLVAQPITDIWIKLGRV